MRNALTALLLLPGIALAAPDFVTDFIAPLLETPAQSNDSIHEGNFDLVKRQATGCFTGYRPCANLNAPDLCCRTNEVCSQDRANNVACCPFGAACTGTIEPVGPTRTGSFVPASTTTQISQSVPVQTSFVQSGTAPFRSLLPNQFYPFPVIATTHVNAQACSSAYTACQTDVASCTNALANGVPGVTISGPNGGATITAIASVGQQQASSICSSLSSEACSGLVVEACNRYGSASAGVPGGARNLCGNIYGVGAGVAAAGIAGLLR